MLGRCQGFHTNQTGGVAIPFALCLVMLLGMAAIVIDLGHAYVVKQEMQKACEAGACAGATALFLNSDGTPSADPQWDHAVTAATNAVKQNIVDGTILSDFNSINVEKGYWDCTWGPNTTPDHLIGYLNPAGYSPTTPPQYPAVKVSLTKTAGGTGTSAPLATYLASVVGINTMEVRSSSVAARFYPSTIYNAFPFAIPKTFFTKDANGILEPNCGPPPATFNVSNVPSTTDPGQWTTFNETNPSSNTVNSMIIDHNTTVSIGNQVNLTNGTQNDIYKTVRDYCIGKTYMAVVVDMDSGNPATVVGFVAVKIKDADNGSNAYVTCEWVPGYVNPLATGAGPAYTPLPAKLVQ